MCPLEVILFTPCPCRSHGDCGLGEGHHTAPS